MAMPEPAPFPFETLTEAVASVDADGALSPHNEPMRSLLAACGGGASLASLPLDAGARALLAAGDRITALIGGQPFELGLHGTDRRWLLARDVGDRERAEASELAATRVRLLGRLAASIVHDFNNLLGSAMGLASMLVSNTSDPGERRLLEELQAGSQRSATLARGLARLLQVAPRQWRQTAAGDLVDEALAVVRRIATMQSVPIETRVAAGLPPIRVVADEVLQLLLHSLIAVLGRRPRRVFVDVTLQRRVLGAGRERACVGVRVLAEGCESPFDQEAAPGDAWQPKGALAMSRMGGELAVAATADQTTIDYVWPALPLA